MNGLLGRVGRRDLAALGVAVLAITGAVAVFGIGPGGDAETVASASRAQEDTMHIQVVTFSLNAMTHAEYLKVGDEVFVPGLNEVPGLLAKIWLHDPVTNTYGGIYTWRDRQAMVDFTQSELFSAFVGNPSFVNIASQDFDMLEAQTRMTNGLPVAVAPSKAKP
jgi:hypothetical protein